MIRLLAALALVTTVVLLIPPLPPAWTQTAPVRFEDVTARAGIDAVAIDPANPKESGDWGFIAVADYDRDGWDDILLNTHPGFKLYRNNGNGTFSLVAGLLPPLSPETQHRHVVLWCDLDRDRDDDLFIFTGFDLPTVDLWLRNDGGRFTSIAGTLGTQDPQFDDWAATCADIDHNGWPDVLKARHANPSVGADLPSEHLWMNFGGTFREEAQARGFTSRTRAKRPYALQCADLNRDGYPECAATGNNYNFWYLNKGNGTVLGTTGVYNPIAGLSPYLHDAHWADFNGDGALDVAIVDTFTTKEPAGDNAVIRVHCGNGRLVAEPSRADGLRQCWKTADFYAADPRSLAAGDFDNDGDVDLFLSRQGGVVSKGREAKAADWLYVNNGSGAFTEAAELAGAAGPVGERYGGGGAAVIDFDRDGRLDLIVGYNALHAPGPFRLYRNVSPERNAWVGFILRAPLILGAEVKVTACGTTQVSQVTARTGWLAQDTRNVHFGLGSCSGDIRVAIRWPDGRETTASLGSGSYYVASPEGFTR